MLIVIVKMFLKNRYMERHGAFVSEPVWYMVILIALQKVFRESEMQNKIFRGIMIKGKGCQWRLQFRIIRLCTSEQDVKIQIMTCWSYKNRGPIPVDYNKLWKIHEERKKLVMELIITAKIHTNVLVNHGKMKMFAWECCVGYVRFRNVNQTRSRTLFDCIENY